MLVMNVDLLVHPCVDETAVVNGYYYYASVTLGYDTVTW